jgi:hypothetical protein
VAVPELSCARRQVSSYWASDGPGAAAGPGGESWSHEARGGPGAVLCQETGVGATGRGGRGAAARPGGGSWSHEAHGGSGATLC